MKTATLPTILASLALVTAGLFAPSPSTADTHAAVCAAQGFNTCPKPIRGRLAVPCIELAEQPGTIWCIDCDGDRIFHEVQRTTSVLSCHYPDGTTKLCEVSVVSVGKQCNIPIIASLLQSIKAQPRS